MAVLTWIKSKRLFLKIQVGAGAALDWYDIEDGMVDYVLWGTFLPECIDIDEEVEMVFLDGGLLMSNKPITADESIPNCYYHAFEKPYADDDVIVLMHDDDCCENRRTGVP